MTAQYGPCAASGGGGGDRRARRINSYPLKDYVKKVHTTAGWKEGVYAIFIALCCHGKTLKPFFFFSGTFIKMFVHRDPKCMQLLLISAKYNGSLLILRTFVLNLLQK
jgi:hypothetical protein